MARAAGGRAAAPQALEGTLAGSTGWPVLGDGWPDFGAREGHMSWATPLIRCTTR